jgi:hypothetical protein
MMKDDPNWIFGQFAIYIEIKVENDIRKTIERELMKDHNLTRESIRLEMAKTLNFEQLTNTTKMTTQQIASQTRKFYGALEKANISEEAITKAYNERVEFYKEQTKEFKSRLKIIDENITKLSRKMEKLKKENPINILNHPFFKNTIPPPKIYKNPYQLNNALETKLQKEAMEIPSDSIYERLEEIADMRKKGIGGFILEI